MFPADSPFLDIAHVAIETTGRFGSVAVLRGQRIIRKVNLNPDQRSAATLAPVLQGILKWCKQTHQNPSFISVADGPGSFTGLRIGVTTAKTLCYALELPLVSVDSLAAIAAAAFHTNPSCQAIWAVIDAYRGQVFHGRFERPGLLPDAASVPDDWTAHPQTIEVIGQKRWETQLEQKPPQIGLAGDPKPLGARSANALQRDCDAIGVGLLALRAASLGQFSDPMQLVPRYLKVSAAEEKMSER